MRPMTEMRACETTQGLDVLLTQVPLPVGYDNDSEETADDEVARS
jgi:hypothetical protein